VGPRVHPSSASSLSRKNVTVAVSGLTLSNATTNQNGGAIRNLGALTLTGLVISNNQTTAGGSALFNGGRAL